MKKDALRDAEREAREIIGGRSATPRRVLELENVLRAGRRFGLARMILERCEDHPDPIGDGETKLKIAQKHALCTYKDPDLPADQKLEDAERILQTVDDLKTTTDQETLGLAGAIYKRKWEQTAQERHLEISLAYYYRGYQQGVASDHGYTAINAAFVLDLLADLESIEAQPAPLVAATGAQRRSLARRIRQTIIATLPALPDQPANHHLNESWWFLLTLGEAYFGLDDCANAEKWLMNAAAIPDVPDWEQESSARQLAALLRIKENAEHRGGPKLDPCMRDVLWNFLGTNGAALESVVRGKIGLALSGGGFRASLYHIGVLARLAELDLLRHVECLSCVSGGSIVGAHFYLEARKLLQDKPDGAITRDDYVALVRRMENDFFEGVKSNIRTQIAAEWLTNLKMIFVPAYSRTMRAGELYEREIYSRVSDGEGGRPRWLSELKVLPKGEPQGFSPKDHNWRRAAKVPILVLNATTLNSGHNWQFTTTWMGEPPAANSEIDANYRLRRMYYTEAPPPHDRFRLGYAVAASACVPGIFEPLTLVDLYERFSPAEGRKVRPVVRLVDGGVYDNQGIAALLAQGCSVLLVSDASGQMDDRDFPSNSLLGVPLRANSILQGRVRVSQFEELSSRRRGGLLRGLMFVHLKKDLEIEPVDWIDSQEPSKPPSVDPLTPYGIQRHVQLQLAAIRTDLDSFSEAEAYALMASGYLMAEHALRNSILGFPVQQRRREPWKFLAIEPLLKEARQETFARQLRVSGFLFFKVWLLMRELQVLGGILAVLLLCLLAYAGYTWWEGEIFTLTVKGAAVMLVVAALPLLGLGFVAKLVNYRKTATEVLIGIGMATFGFLVARLHLHVFDKLFLWQGGLQRLLAKESSRAADTNAAEVAE